MTEQLDTYDELVTRIAYHIVNGVARGVPARDMAATAVCQTLMWRKTQDEAENRTKKGTP